jgi:putative flippase GtrA
VINGRVVRFAAIGVVNTGTYYGLYLTFKLVLPYLVAHILAFLLSMTGSFFLNCHFTFRTNPTWRKFLLFPLSNVTNFVVTSAGLYLLVQFAGLDQRIAPLAAASIAIPVTFVVARIVLVGRPATAEGHT